MKGQPVDQLVYECMFPKPKPTDPQNFQAFLQRSLIPEVRQETHAFYGHLETQEAKYPGLDYTHRTHRIRLSRWPWHRRLFRNFDALGLTDSEISSLTKWEGTKWAKEKFEKEQGITIRDTAADGFPDWTEPIDRHAVQDNRSVRVSTVGIASLDDDENMDAEESDEELESVGVELNERLRAQAARREAGDTSVVLDEEWEQWLKNAIESGELALLTERMTEDMFRRAPTSSIPATLIPSGMLNMARAGQWSDIPEFLQPMIRRTIDNETSARGEHAQTSATRSTLQSSVVESSRSPLVDESARFRVPWPRRTYSDLRLPVNDSTVNQRTAEASEA